MEVDKWAHRSYWKSFWKETFPWIKSKEEETDELPEEGWTKSNLKKFHLRSVKVEIKVWALKEANFTHLRFVLIDLQTQQDVWLYLERLKRVEKHFSKIQHLVPLTNEVHTYVFA